MGNTSPNSNNLLIHIETEKPFYNSGSSIEGAVFVEAKENFKFDALYIRVEGDEWCQWFEGTSKNRHKYTGSDHFYSVEYILNKYDQQVLERGKYVHPFSIELSDNLPGTFSSAKYDARIGYKLVAYFASYNSSEQYQVCSLPLVVRQPFRQEITSYEGESTKSPVYCGCCGKGEVTLKANFERNVCFEGESVGVAMEVDNSSGGDRVTSVEVRIVQYTFISSNNGTSRTYKHTIHKDILDSKPIQKGEVKRISHNIQVPEVLHQTAISTLVANYYRLQVTATQGVLSSDNPSIYAPLFILKKSFSVKKSKKSKTKNQGEYNNFKPTLFRAPEYYFRKNKNLSVMNFRHEDMIDKIESELLKG